MEVLSVSKPLRSTRVVPQKTVDETIGAHASLISSQLQSISEAIFPPTASKTLRRFTSGEAAKLISVSDSTLRKMSLAGDGPQPELTSNGRRLYSLGQINELRERLASTSRGRNSHDFLPRRGPDDHLQVVAVTNFKGGSGKTTTSVHLSQYLALQGYRVLALDLDPQASLSALLGILPETHVGHNETLYAAIRYDEDRRPLKDVIRQTYFDGLDLVPGNLELMEFEHTTPRALTGASKSEQEIFFLRIASALGEVADDYDVVVIDCPPQLGYLTLSGLCAATSMVVTVHPQMLDVASMSQFLLMTHDLLAVVREAGGELRYDFIKYLLTRFEPQDAPQTKVAALLRNLFDDSVMTNPMLKSAAVSDAGLTKQTLYEIGRENLTRSTYDRAMESLDAVNLEIENEIRAAWGRKKR
ncbi:MULTISPECIES: plasmid partitioning protein RepA [unclassified Rhizobium]|uniref:plasmid partitioning protein RepA n=1 Tax=unclassified Rhizobium TaxID=2613769 RepID=UPI000B533479|nr:MULTISPECIES: plasmid partitioning protein RepA [unclassified Rhizobium]